MAVNVWYDYRTVWSMHPWVLVYALIVVAIFVLAVVGTFIGGPLAILFIPSLAGAYAHHLLVQKRLDN
jgi:autotransporter translocation and assembly factor TamB